MASRDVVMVQDETNKSRPSAVRVGNPSAVDIHELIKRSKAFKTPRREIDEAAPSPYPYEDGSNVPRTPARLIDGDDVPSTKARQSSANKSNPSGLQRGFAKMTRKMFYSKQYDDQSFRKSLAELKSIQPELLKIPKLATNFVRKVREANAASLLLAQQLKRLEIEGMNTGVISANKRLRETHDNLFNTEMEQVFSNWILDPVTRFHSKVIDSVPHIEEALDMREKAFYAHDVKKAKFKKARKKLDTARERALSKWSVMKNFGPSVEELEEDLRVKKNDVLRAEAYYQSCTHRLTEEIMHVHARHALMLRAEISGITKTYHIMHDQSKGLMSEVRKLLPSSKTLMSVYTDRLESWERAKNTAPPVETSIRNLPRDDYGAVRRRSTRDNTSTRHEAARKSIRYGIATTGANKIFGGELETCMGDISSDRPSAQMPVVVRQCAAFIRSHCLDQEGLFRIPGDMRVVSKLKSMYNMRSDAPLDLDRELVSDLDDDDADAAASRSYVSPARTAATLLKAFFRELKSPLLPEATIAELQCVAENNTSASDVDLVTELRRVVNAIPSPNRQVFRFLLRLLADVASKETLNRMGPENLAVCWTPSLVFEAKRSDNDDDNDDDDDAEDDPTETLMAFAKLKPAMQAITLLLKHASGVLGSAAATGRASAASLSDAVRRASIRSIERTVSARAATPPPATKTPADEGGEIWKVVFQNGVAYRKSFGDLRSRVLDVPGPVYGDIVRALEVRENWLRVRLSGDTTDFWLPWRIEGLGTILCRVEGETPAKASDDEIRDLRPVTDADDDLGDPPAVPRPPGTSVPLPPIETTGSVRIHFSESTPRTDPPLPPPG